MGGVEAQDVDRADEACVALLQIVSADTLVTFRRSLAKSFAEHRVATEARLAPSDAVDGILAALRISDADESERAAVQAVLGRLVSLGEDVRQAAEFLHDRVSELEGDLVEGVTANEYYGHVIPALARLRMALDASLASPAGEGKES
jgi:hypothetical protein